ncbi:MAG: hypothetical protein WC661_16640 [Opitutaceae bacterium]|jgi:hypothetical protein
MAQGLSVRGPCTRSSTQLKVSSRVFAGAITIAATSGIPTEAEIKAAIEAIYTTAVSAPQLGDLLALSIGTKVKFVGHVIPQLGSLTGSPFYIQFEYDVDGDEEPEFFFALLAQAGMI